MSVHTESMSVRKVGFLADTHVKTADDLPPEAFKAFEGCDLEVDGAAFRSLVEAALARLAPFLDDIGSAAHAKVLAALSGERNPDIQNWRQARRLPSGPGPRLVPRARWRETAAAHDLGFR